MSNPVETFTTAAVRGQEATTSAMNSWADGMQAFTGGQSLVADLPGMVRRYFDAVQQVLDSQRRFAETMIGVAESAQSFTNQATRVAKDALDAASSATNGVASLTNAAKSQTDARARVAKVAGS